MTPCSKLFICGAAIISCAALSSAARAQQPFISEVRTFAYDFCPIGWLEANGQLLEIASFETLFFLIGTTYGGDGQNNFALPDLRGRTIVSVGQGPGLSSYVRGERAGAESRSLSAAETPVHQHSIPGGGAPSAISAPTASKGALAAVRAAAGVASAITQSAGAGQPHEERQPYLAMISCIATEGLFPSEV